MANIKISQLTSATTPLAGTEVVELVQGGASVKVAVNYIGNSADALPFASLAGRAYCDFYDTTDQTGSTTVPTPVKFGTTVLNTGITIANNGSGDPTRVTFTAAGKYRVIATLQCTNSDTAPHIITAWLRVNGTDVVASAGKIVVTKTADGGVASIRVVGIITVTAAQYAEVFWVVDNTTITLDATASAAGPPALPAFASARIIAERIA